MDDIRKHIKNGLDTLGKIRETHKLALEPEFVKIGKTSTIDFSNPVLLFALCFDNNNKRFRLSGCSRIRADNKPTLTPTHISSFHKHLLVRIDN